MGGILIKLDLLSSLRCIPWVPHRQCRYVEWTSSVVPMYKKNRKLRVCIDFRDLNKATPMDGYPMPIANMLVDATVGHYKENGP